MKTFDLTPDPNVLIALTRTDLKPLDALCELIDNAIDSFREAIFAGSPIEHPMVMIQLPGPSEIERGTGTIVVRDNGPGMTADQAQNALRAGYTAKTNPYDTLGLFGMGFNISTGKLGRTTRFVTTRKSDDKAIEAVIDLVRMKEQSSYSIPVNNIEKPEQLLNGTVVEISGWWPAGDANHDFVRKLISYGKPKIRGLIGRRYATLLRIKKFRIVVNGEPCEPFEHCAWAPERYVTRQKHGKVPARIEFDELVGTQRRCNDCNALMNGSDKCPACESSNPRTVEERITGWVGIQRFDDKTKFGIDLIRNGRSIRIGEKKAFFEFEDEFGETILDYPVDSTFGRIIGEVHLNHVPVDFMKSDFQRSSVEWLRAMEYLRGKSSLQPKQKGAGENKSPVFLLYQGYRKIRNPGLRDMYMGFNDGSGPKRLSRDEEREFIQKFENREPGYFDDEEWWKQVEAAERPPLDQLIECPKCGMQVLEGTEECDECGEILLAKTCRSDKCGASIQRSAAVCPKCGESQYATVHNPWTCDVCEQVNDEDASTCSKCGEPQGAPHPASKEALLNSSSKDDELSINGLSIVLADGTTHTQPIDVDVSVSHGPIRPIWGADPVPLVVDLSVEKIEIFIDLKHEYFATLRERPQSVIAHEAAQYLLDQHSALASGRFRFGHNLSNIGSKVLEEGWGEDLRETPDKLQRDILSFFDSVREALVDPVAQISEDIYQELSEEDQKALAKNLLESRGELTQIPDLKASGEFIRFVDVSVLVHVYRQHPHLFFDGRIWSSQYSELSEVDLDANVVDEVRRNTFDQYRNCLEDIAGYIRLGRPGLRLTERARASLDLLLKDIVV